MTRVRFAPSPTGSLHVGGALSAVANRSFADEHGGVFLLRIDDTDPDRNVPGGEEAILADLEWLGIAWDEGPVRQHERADAHRAAAARLEESGQAWRDEDGSLRFAGEHRRTLLRADGSPTYHLASVVDDLELGVTHVIRGKDHLANVPLHTALSRALGGEPPEYMHHGLIVGADGRKLSKREPGATVAGLRGAGIPAEAVRRYLEELGIPRGDVHYDEARIRRLAVEAIASLPDAVLAQRAEAPLVYVPALRGARDLNEARATAASLEEAPAMNAAPDAEPTLTRYLELASSSGDPIDADAARAILRELKAVGGDLRALRIALTGHDRGPELWAVLVALGREEAAHRASMALTSV
jgi:glutamyl/glutaminyl-tRNA synthetase